MDPLTITAICTVFTVVFTVVFGILNLVLKKQLHPSEGMFRAFLHIIIINLFTSSQQLKFSIATYVIQIKSSNKTELKVPHNGLFVDRQWKMNIIIAIMDISITFCHDVTYTSRCIILSQIYLMHHLRIKKSDGATSDFKKCLGARFWGVSLPYFQLRISIQFLLKS